MSHPPKSELNGLREDLESKQRATTFPDTLNAGRNVDEFLWKGDIQETKIQRAGLGVFASAYIFIGILALCGALNKLSFPTRLFCVGLGVFALSIGVKFAINAFRRKTNTESR
jgi:hypothetical protein